MQQAVNKKRKYTATGWNHGKFEEMIAHRAEERYMGLVRALLFDLGIRDCDMMDGPWLAGGTLRRLVEGQIYTGADFDFFFKSKEQKNEFKDRIEAFYDCEVVFESDNAVTYKMLYGHQMVIMQLIHLKYYDTPSEVISEFDLIACQLITNGNVLVYGTNTFEQIDKRILKVNKNVLTKEMYSAVHTMRRMIKMGADGYRMSAYQMAEFLKYVQKHPEIIREEKPMSPEYDENGNELKVPF